MASIQPEGLGTLEVETAVSIPLLPQQTIDLPAFHKQSMSVNPHFSLSHGLTHLISTSETHPKVIRILLLFAMCSTFFIFLFGTIFFHNEPWVIALVSGSSSFDFF